MRKQLTLTLIALLGLGLHAHAEDEGPSQRALSLAAGYKALFTCSALFNAGKTLDAIAVDELSGIYPEYQAPMAALPDAMIDREMRTVSVAFAADMPPRIAAWRPHLGCAALPPGLAIDAVDILPRVEPEETSADAAMPLATGDGPEALAAVIDDVFDGDFGARTSAVVIVQNDQVIAERYAEGVTPTTSQRTWSVAKSIAATVIGAAAHQGLIDIDAPATIPEWHSEHDPRRAITNANLLHMSSGLGEASPGHRSDEMYFGGGLVTDHATLNELAGAPGKTWRYANNDTLLALRSLRAEMNDDAAYLALPFDALLHRIGMNNTHLETDWQGNFMLSSQVWSTARDLARFGLLYLNDGVWNGERLLPEGWVEYATTPAPSRAGRDGTLDYGAQFWITQGVEGVPDGSYAALGFRGQAVVIVPSRNAVIVRRGYDPAGERFDAMGFAAAVLGALE